MAKEMEAFPEEKRIEQNMETCLEEKAPAQSIKTCVEDIEYLLLSR